MSGFKLLAIRTGKKISEEEQLIPNTHNYLKGLSENSLFYFLNTHEISEDGACIKSREIGEVNLYSNEDMFIEISAIVGANGSGKSTLLEIIYLIINNISISKEILYEDRQRVNIPESYLFCDLYFQIEHNLFYRLQCEYFKDNELELTRGGSRIYESNYNEGKDCFEFTTPIDVKEFDFEKLFYSIVVNYSIHGLNDTYLGYWINYLFHKNDSYQTPIVINPMRTHGDFNINRENEFARYRLLSNVIVKATKTEKPVFLTDDLYIDSIDFRVNMKKIEYLEYAEYHTETNGEKKRTINELLMESAVDLDTDVISPLIEVFYPDKTSSSLTVYSKEVKEYIAKKLYKIAFTYPKFYKFLDLKSASTPLMFLSSFDKSKLAKYFKELKKDNSHVTLKLRQAINFLIYQPIEKEDLKLNDLEVFNIPFQTIVKRISVLEGSPINYIPPSLFKIKINLKSNRTRETVLMENMSSGQLQLINSVQSTLYHLNNLDSYYDLKQENQLSSTSDTESNFKKIKYKNALIILDEVELYFHPEYQRILVDYFISEIKNLQLKLVKNIHILFVTHSPFILSDMPSHNILMLDENGPKAFNTNTRTFGANIHDLLADKFFLTNSIGKFATSQIDEILNLYHNISTPNAKKATFEFDYEKNKSKYDYIVKSIGDDVIREVLSSQLEFIHDFFKEDEEN